MHQGDALAHMHLFPHLVVRKLIGLQVCDHLPSVVLRAHTHTSAGAQAAMCTRQRTQEELQFRAHRCAMSQSSTLCCAAVPQRGHILTPEGQTLLRYPQLSAPDSAHSSVAPLVTMVFSL